MSAGMWHAYLAVKFPFPESRNGSMSLELHYLFQVTWIHAWQAGFWQKYLETVSIVQGVKDVL